MDTILGCQLPTTRRFQISLLHVELLSKRPEVELIPADLRTQLTQTMQTRNAENMFFYIVF